VERTVVITNPASGRGRGSRMLPAVRAAFAAIGVTDIRPTERAGDESTLVHRALDAGATTIVAVGGDGTWGKCAGALAASGAECRIAFVQGGTGNDFAKNLPAPAHDVGAMARLIAGPHAEWRVDMGRVESGGQGNWFLNVAGFGFDAAVLEDTQRGGALSGNAVYISAALKQLLSYPGIDLRNDAFGPHAHRAMMVVFSNGLSFGGAFRIAPQATVTDGLIDCVQIGDVRGLARIPLFVRAIRGAHLTHREVRRARAQRFTLTFGAPPTFDCDGELCRANDAAVTIQTVTGVLRVVASSTPTKP
jgi:diacylglycerol kinase (ATP)